MPERELPAVFVRLLKQSGMVFSMSSDFVPVPTKVNDSVLYNHAIAAVAPGKFEIRYQIVDTAPGEGAGTFTPTASADLDTLRQTMLMSVVMNVASKIITPPNPFPVEAVQKDFGAEWGAICRLGLKPSAFSEGFRECVVVALHKGAAAAYVFMLYDDFESASGLIESNFVTLKFA